MKYYIIAGEASGDLHAANLVKALHQIDSKAEFRGWGGNLMQAAGVTLVKHYKDLAFMGFVEVIKNLPAILANFKYCKQDITAYKPDVVIFVDYPGFNLRMAEWAYKQGYKTAYYILPQAWAWKENRVEKIKRYIDAKLIILPFEQDFYKKHEAKVNFVGHPLVDAISHWTENQSIQHTSQKQIALLPGSRKQEIQNMLPIMLQASKLFPEYQFVIATAPGIERTFYSTFIQPYPNVLLNEYDTYTLLSNSEAALVTSGTATLETALFKVPQIVCYKGNPVSYAIAKRVIKVPYISLVNLILNQLAVPELIQHDLTIENIVEKLRLLLDEQHSAHQNMKAAYNNLIEKLHFKTDASYNAAEKIYELATLA